MHRLGAVLDRVFKVMDARYAAVFAVEMSGALRPVLARFRDGRTSHDLSSCSLPLARLVVSERRGRVLIDLLPNDGVYVSTGLFGPPIRLESIVCAPVFDGERVIALLYASASPQAREYDDDDLGALTAVAAWATPLLAAALRINDANGTP